MKKNDLIRCKQELFWATARYIRVWIEFDGILRQTISRSNKLTPELVRKIAIRYYVVRGIPNPKPNAPDKFAKGIASLVNSYRSRMLDSELAQRALYCEAIAIKAQDSNLTQSLQISAITKFAWFLVPENWTPFDKYAANGIRVSQSNNKSRMKSFYEKLDDLGFLDIASRMQLVLNKTSFPQLPAARILDEPLMMRGGRFRKLDSFIDEQETFLRVIPSAFRNQIRHTAEALESNFGNNLLLP